MTIIAGLQPRCSVLQSDRLSQISLVSRIAGVELVEKGSCASLDGTLSCPEVHNPMIQETEHAILSVLQNCMFCTCNFVEQTERDPAIYQYLYPFQKLTRGKHFNRMM